MSDLYRRLTRLAKLVKLVAVSSASKLTGNVSLMYPLADKANKPEMKSAIGPRIVVNPPGPRAREIIDEDQKILSTALSRKSGLVAVRAEGPYIEDADGNVFLDFGSSIAVTVVGHNNLRVVQAVERQARQLFHINSFDYVSLPQLEYARRIVDLAPGDFPKRVFFSNSGAEAVETALKAAKYYTKRHGVIAFVGGFHGRTLGALGVTSTSAIVRRHFTGSMMANVAFAPFANPYRNPFAGDCATEALQYLEHYVLDRSMPTEDCAAIIVEPIQGADGYIVPPRAFLQGLQRICRERDILLIADEVQTGFGKTGFLFASEGFGIAPDIICTAKTAAAGLPMGVTIARSELLEWEEGAHSNTLGGNPVVASAALAVLDTLIEDGLLERAQRIGDRLRSGLQTIHEKDLFIGDIRGMGALVGFEFVLDRRSKEPAVDLRNQFVKACFERGLLVLSAGRSSVRLAPPLILTEEEIDVGLEIIEESLSSVI